jgi:DNA-binding NarL/FixJ family response regulator
LIRILLADDHALMRAGFRALLEHEGDISVVAEAADGEEAVALARETRPDVVLMDLSMPGIGGVEATRLILADENLAETRILILTTFETAENVYDGLRSGASGFMLKDGDPDELIRAIRVVAAGDALLAPKVTSRLLADLAAQPRGCPGGAIGAGLAHGKRARSNGARRDRPDELRYRREARGQPSHGEDARKPRHAQAARSRPRTARRARVRVWPRTPWSRQGPLMRSTL